MAGSALSGAQFIFGNLSAMLASIFGSPVADPDQDAGPSGVYQGWATLDPRIVYVKDKVTGFTGVVQAHFPVPRFRTFGGQPTTVQTTGIATAQTVTSGTAMTFAASSLGLTTNIPIRPFTGVLNGSTPVTAAMALEFGFAFGNVTSGSLTVPVADSAAFTIGMPLVIGGVGNSAGTVPLLTNCTGTPTATSITIGNAPSASNSTAPIGMGDLWGPSEVGFPLPAAAFPFFAVGPATLLDHRQCLARGLQIAGTNAACTGGTFLVSGWDVYGQPMSQLVTVAAGVSIGYTKKCFKYLKSIVPQFTDTTAGHTYTAGNSDLFDFAYRSMTWEESDVVWAGVPMPSATGWVAADTTNPATTLTGDVRGTIQLTSLGPGSGIGSTASNGTVSNLALTGNRLDMCQFLGSVAVTQATQQNAASMFGATQS